MNKFKLESVELAITNACTHKCPYCYLGNPSEEKNADLETIYTIIDILNRNCVENVTFVGGDPAQHPRIFDILKYTKEKSKMNVSIMSNTMDIPGHSVFTMAKYIDSIDFTLHGRTVKEHDSFCRKKGAYNKIVNRLKQYHKQGVKINIAINLIPATHDKIFEMVEALILKGIRINTLFLQRIIPLGRAILSDEYNVNTTQINKALAQVSSLEEFFGINISVEDPFPLCCIDEKYHVYMKGCPEGKTRMPIDGEGNVSCCGTITDRKIGNILSEPFEKIWDNSSAFDDFRLKKYLLDERCVGCKMADACGGGCPVCYTIYRQRGIDFIKNFEG